MTTLYQELLATGCEIDSHESDLYVRATPEARAILRERKPFLSFFKSEIDGATWIEIPFMYEPFWEKRAEVTL